MADAIAQRDDHQRQRCEMSEGETAAPAARYDSEDHRRRDSAEHGNSHILERKNAFVGHDRKSACGQTKPRQIGKAQSRLPPPAQAS